MCGFAGFVDLSHAGSADFYRQVARRMGDRIAHRGPDDAGIWIDVEAGVALSHRRLAVIDLSPAGRQPMTSRCGRYVLIYNGEIYNYQDVKSELEALSADVPLHWCGHSDTEVVLAAIAQWGVEDALGRLNGMFAFVLWDKLDRVLYLARDRLGEKPLYYGWMNRTFLFGSELKALRAHPSWDKAISRDALALFVRHNYVPAPYSIYEDVHKLLPGNYLTLATRAASPKTLTKAYWAAAEVIAASKHKMLTGPSEEVIEQCDQLLRDAVKLRMVSDVPLGAFLSGGIDSSTVVALMQVQSDRPVKTFTVGFKEADFDEAGHARAIARHLSTDHTELYVSPREALEVIPLLPILYDEPFSDSSQIPTFLISRLAREHVTVSLSGDGGDELFAGYNRYNWGRDIWTVAKFIPANFRGWMARQVTLIPPTIWESALTRLFSLLPNRFRFRNPGEMMHKFAEIFATESPQMLYYHLTSHWKAPELLVIDSTEPPTIVNTRNGSQELSDFCEHMMFLDLMSYLPDDILVKLDRASMGVSLEGRVPLLDHRVVEFAWRLPLSMKIRNGQGKWIIRQVLGKYVPADLFDRPKMGFALPLDVWLRSSLKDWAEDLLNETRLRQEGFFHAAPIRQKWLEHLSGRRNWSYDLWDVLMFQAWLNERNNRG